MQNCVLLKSYNMEEYYENNDYDSKVNPEPKKATIGSVKDLIDGSLLTKDFVVKQFPFVMFLVVLAILYIGNRYNAEKIVRETIKLQSELKELRYESISAASELMYISKQSEVAKIVNKNGLGLIESIVPPKKIVVKKIDN